MVQLIDLSGYIEAGQPVYPGHHETQIWVTKTHEGSGYESRKKLGRETAWIERKLKARRQGDTDSHPIVRALLVSEHGPTHIDALSHLDPTSDGTIDRMSLDWFYGDAVGVDVSHVTFDRFIEVDDIEQSLADHDLSIRDGDAITLYTGHYDRHYDLEDEEQRYSFIHENTGLSEDAAYWLADQGVRNIGIDAPSIDHGSALTTQEYPGHVMCGERDVLNMENMANLDAVAGLRYTLCAIPLKIRGGTGSPIRPVAILE